MAKIGLTSIWQRRWAPMLGCRRSASPSTSPNKDRHGKEFGNQRKWVLEAIQLLSNLNGGATAMPPVEGGWLADDGNIVWENPVVVYSFLQGDRFLQNLPRVREFLHRLGRETDQGEIAFEFADRFYRIRTFDLA